MRRLREGGRAEGARRAGAGLERWNGTDINDSLPHFQTNGRREREREREGARRRGRERERERERANCIAAGES